MVDMVGGADRTGTGHVVPVGTRPGRGTILRVIRKKALDGTQLYAGKLPTDLQQWLWFKLKDFMQSSCVVQAAVKHEVCGEDEAARLEEYHSSGSFRLLPCTKSGTTDRKPFVYITR